MSWLEAVRKAIICCSDYGPEQQEQAFTTSAAQEHHCRGMKLENSALGGRSNSATSGLFFPSCGTYLKLKANNGVVSEFSAFTPQQLGESRVRNVPQSDSHRPGSPALAARTGISSSARRRTRSTISQGRFLGGWREERRRGMNSWDSSLSQATSGAHTTALGLTPPPQH